MILRARYVAPVSRPVIENGAVRIETDRIAAVGSTDELRGERTTDFGNAVICPGFVNAHTHLELTALAGIVPPSHDFTGWLTMLVAELRRIEPGADSIERSVRDGIDRSLDAGVTTIGDITRNPARTRPVLAASPLRGVSFGEVIAIGKLRPLLEERIEAATDKSWQTDRFRTGISPHSPYSVEPDGLRACAQRAADLDVPLMIHLAETMDEATFTEKREGPLVAHLRSLGVWDDAIPAARCGPIELASRVGLLNLRTILAHVNYVTDRDIARIAGSGASVAYCPRTHDAFGHEPHRFRDMLEAGINVCVATDSLASNPSLSVLDELRFLRRRHPDVSPAALLEMGTLHGATALGLDRDVGTLDLGKAADLTVVPLERIDPQAGWAAVFDQSADPLATIIDGNSYRDTGAAG